MYFTSLKMATWLAETTRKSQLYNELQFTVFVCVLRMTLLYNISKQVVWERWSETLATTIVGYHPLDFFL